MQALVSHSFSVEVDDECAHLVCKMEIDTVSC